jgi:HEPN domain-containing protein
MSRDEDRYEALRWLRTADEDLDVAKVLHDQEKFSHSCFSSQQAAEKAVKALWYACGGDPWGHSIQKLIQEIPDDSFRGGVEQLIEIGAFLDKYYIPTRYPNGLPDLTPGTSYFGRDSEGCIKAAEGIVAKVRALLA